MRTNEVVQSYTSGSAQREAEESMQALMSRAATDWNFRQQLLVDPRAAIAEFKGCDVSAVPAGLDVAFIESEPGATTIVLPKAIDLEAELSEADLASVAGGSETLEWVAASLALAVAIKHIS